MREIIYIEFLNKDKGFKKDRIEFEGNDLGAAIKWGRDNLGNFNMDMINYKTVENDYSINKNTNRGFSI